MNKFEECLLDNIRVISVDMFDTLLLRNTKSELCRFYEISKLQASHLRAFDINISPCDLLSSRLFAAKIRYQTAAKGSKEREPDLSSIFQVMFNMLGFYGRVPIEDFLDIEVHYECENLSLNLELFSILKSFSLDKKIIVVSDTYLSKVLLEKLLSYFLGGFYCDVYVSCDLSLTKRFGGIFEHICEKEGCCPSAILHVGDNYISDYVNPIRCGLNAFHLNRAFSFRLLRFINNTFTNAKLRRKIL